MAFREDPLKPDAAVCWLRLELTAFHDRSWHLWDMPTGAADVCS